MVEVIRPPFARLLISLYEVDGPLHAMPYFGTAYPRSWRHALPEVHLDLATLGVFPRQPGQAIHQSPCQTCWEWCEENLARYFISNDGANTKVTMKVRDFVAFVRTLDNFNYFVLYWRPFDNYLE